MHRRSAVSLQERHCGGFAYPLGFCATDISLIQLIIKTFKGVKAEAYNAASLRELHATIHEALLQRLVEPQLRSDKLRRQGGEQLRLRFA